MASVTMSTVGANEERGVRGDLAGRLGRFVLLTVAVAIAGLVAGWLFGKGQPRAAAGAVIADFVETSDSLGNDPEPADPDQVAPMSGNHLGTPQCGVRDVAIDNDDHLASLAAGFIVIRHLPALEDEELAALVAFAGDRDRVLVSPEPRLDVPVVAVSWSHRMRLPEANLELLAAFRTAQIGIAPNPLPTCP